MGDIYDGIQRSNHQYYMSVDWEATLNKWFEEDEPLPDECQYCGFEDFTEPTLSHSIEGLVDEKAVAHARAQCLMCGSQFSAAKVLDKGDLVRNE